MTDEITDPILRKNEAWLDGLRKPMAVTPAMLNQIRTRAKLKQQSTPRKRYASPKSTALLPSIVESNRIYETIKKECESVTNQMLASLECSDKTLAELYALRQDFDRLISYKAGGPAGYRHYKTCAEFAFTAALLIAYPSHESEGEL